MSGGIFSAVAASTIFCLAWYEKYKQEAFGVKEHSSYCRK
jgi:hypothetical protein